MDAVIFINQNDLMQHFFFNNLVFTISQLYYAMKPLSRQFEFRQVFHNEITLLLFRFLFISKINEVSLLRFLRTFSVM